VQTVCTRHRCERCSRLPTQERCDSNRRTTWRAAAQLSTVNLTAMHIASTEFLTPSRATGLFARRKRALPIRSRTASERPIRGENRAAQLPDITG